MKIIDAHVHFGPKPRVRILGNGIEYVEDQLLRNMDRAGVDMSLIMGFPHVYDNDYVIRAARKHPDRFIPWAYMDPWHHPRPAESVKRLAGEGFLGIKLRPVSLLYHLSDHYLLDPVIDACQENGLRVSMHTGDDACCSPLAVGEMAQTFPEVQFIMIHGGFRLFVEQALDVGERHPNITLDETGGNVWQVRRALERLGPERMIYGSDSPFMDTRVELKKMRVAIEDPTALSLALGGNASRLFGLDSGVSR